MSEKTMDAVERWRAQMSRPHVIIHELRDIGTQLANEVESDAKVIAALRAGLRELYRDSGRHRVLAICQELGINEQNVEK